MACGQAYGRTTYLATTLQRVPRGTEGAVSAEGTAAGLAAAVAFAALATALGQVGHGARAPLMHCAQTECEDSSACMSAC